MAGLSRDCAVRDIAITMKGDAMKLCITSTGRSLDSDVDPRFGRCAYFIILDSDSMEFEVFENDSSGASGGAGVQSGKFVADKGAKIVLTGNVGPRPSAPFRPLGLR
jgi:predicted Fe-Mo cluster-binding NifX family protein